MTLLTVLHEHKTPALHLRIGDRQRPVQRFAAPGGGTAARPDEPRGQQGAQPPAYRSTDETGLHSLFSRVMRHDTPLPGCGARPFAVTVMTPKSTTCNARPLGSKRAATGRSKPPPPTQEAGALARPLFTAKSSMTPVVTSTRTALK